MGKILKSFLSILSEKRKYVKFTIAFSSSKKSEPHMELTYQWINYNITISMTTIHICLYITSLLPPRKHYLHRTDQHIHIQKQGPVLNIVQIKSCLFIKRKLISPKNLSITSNPRFDTKQSLLPGIISIHFTRHMWSWPYQRHMPQKYAPQRR